METMTETSILRAYATTEAHMRPMSLQVSELMRLRLDLDICSQRALKHLVELAPRIWKDAPAAICQVEACLKEDTPDYVFFGVYEMPERMGELRRSWLGTRTARKAAQKPYLLYRWNSDVDAWKLTHLLVSLPQAHADMNHARTSLTTAVHDAYGNEKVNAAVTLAEERMDALNTRKKRGNPDK